MKFEHKIPYSANHLRLNNFEILSILNDIFTAKLEKGLKIEKSIILFLKSHFTVGT